ncbi:MAG: hypothetical protein RLZZ77_1921 [Bacteroidota bacterium]|jgi:predicted metalloprotease with PDZ domain
MNTIEYKVRIPNAHRHYITFEAFFPALEGEFIDLELPAWRPGRYELGNFAKNIFDFSAYDENGDWMPARKVGKDTWRIQPNGRSFSIGYRYYASELNAGSSFLDQEQLYINPVNCFFYASGNEHLPYRVSLELPQDYQVATGMEKESEHVLLAKDFDQLADCPLIASATLQSFTYESRGVQFYVWCQGILMIDGEKWQKDFQQFTDHQIDLFGSIPCKEYHFLFQFLPTFVRHGVEHCNSTVIALGPGAEFAQKNWYDELLGISCHELYHTWNIKNIRPVEMMPYDFKKENFSRLGFVAEGVTTYMGDLLLARSGVWGEKEWFNELNSLFQSHFDNNGRNYLSVAESSWDTWLDGYTPGIPWRKVSIYNEGALIAFICDVLIMQHSGNKHSLDDVMRDLYKDFGQKQKGYAEVDYQRIMTKWGGDVKDIFEDLVYGTEDYTPYLVDACNYLGLNWTAAASAKYTEWALGLTLEEAPTKATVTAVVENSPADLAGLWIGDEIISINGVAPYKNIQNLIKAAPTELTILRKGILTQVEVTPDSQIWQWKHQVSKSDKQTDEQSAAYQFWIGRRV